MRAIAAATLVGALVAIATGTPLEQQATNTLSSIDTVPTKAQLDKAFPQDPLNSLSSLATDASTEPGIRLRAIHALAKYCTAAQCTSSDVAHDAVVTVINANVHEPSGTPVLALRAAIETLGMMHVSTDVSVLLPPPNVGPSPLDHPSRDIRASTAKALAEICNSQAITPLRVRYSHEPTEQVKLAISDALRILGQCSSNP